MKINSYLIMINKKLEAFRLDISNLDGILAAHSKGKYSEVRILKKFISLNKKYPSNSIIISRMLEFLQLVDNSTIIESYTLEDLEKTYQKISQVFKDDVDINIENYYYLYNVMDKEKKAKSLINKFKKRVDEKFLEAARLESDLSI